MEKIDIVLQGPIYECTYEIANNVASLDFVNNVIISTWRDDLFVSRPNNKKFKFIFSDAPENPGINNLNSQLVSSLAGLKKVQTKFCAKMRSDHIWTKDSYYTMHEFYSKNKNNILNYENGQGPQNRICSFGVHSFYPFHPNDWVFWGNSNDLVELFDIPLCDDINPYFIKNMSYVKYPGEVAYRPESWIGSHYYAKFDNIIYKFMKNPELYIFDNSIHRDEAMKVYFKLITKVIKPFPMKNIILNWPRRNQTPMLYESGLYDGVIWAEIDKYSD